MKDRLQFVHCDTLFKTNIEAKEYVESGDLISYNRPALYAEPMVLKYGDEKNPNILLAIGSVGDGKTPTKENKVFFIDFADIEKSIEEIKGQVEEGNLNLEAVKEQISKIIKSCGFNENGEYVPNQEDKNIKTATSLNEADELLSKAIDDNYEALTSEINIIKNQITKLENFKVNDSNTITHILIKEESGSTLTSNVKLADFRTVGNCNFDNIIIEQTDGIYANVRLSYDEEENKLIFGVNDVVKEFSLPKENHVIGGSYDSKTESLILTFKEPIDGESKTLSIDLSKLIGEWTVLGENTDTPVILTKTPVKSEDILHGAESYQDVLKADVRIAPKEYVPYNILEKTEDNRYLFVNGIADNIKYLKDGKIITVKEALDAVDDNVSSHDGNIIYRKEDGIFANVELEYVAGKNALKFTKTNKNGTTDVKELELNNITFLENIYYDSLTEELVVQYKDAVGEIQELRVPVSSLFEEWVVDNTNHTVTLTKTEHQTAGKDKLSADVNIASTSDNILRVVNHGLHVKGTSDNIKHGNGTVQDALDLLNGTDDTEGSIRNLIKKESDERKQSDAALQGLIETEKTRAEEAEKALDAKILANTTAISEESARAKAAEEANKNSIDSEILRATSEESRIEAKFDTAINKQGTVNSQITESIKNLDTKVTTEISRSTSKDSELENAINTEVQRATGEEKRIETAFNSYKENSERQHTELGNRVTAVEASLTKETENRIKNDQLIGEALSNEIARAKEAEGGIKTDLAELSGKVNTNINNIDTINSGLTSLNDKIDKEIQRATAAETANQTAISEEKAARENKDTELDGSIKANTSLITSESNRAKAVEGLLQEGIDENKTNLESEIQRATAAEKANSDAITALEKKTNVTANNTGTINLTKTVLEDGNGYTLSGTVNVSQELGNIINSDGSALKATVDLVYDGDKNTLTLKTSNNADKVIALNQGSIITSIRYESSTKELVITYQTATGETQEVKVNVADLFNEVSVENPAENAVTLKMTDKLDGSQVITADVNVSTEPNNLLKKVTGNLYVSNAASGIKFEDGKSVVDKFNALTQTVTDNKLDSDAKYSELNGKITVLDGKVSVNTSNITSLQEKDAEIDGNIVEINQKISQEINDRTAADTALGVRIDGVNTKIDTEKTDRTNADAALSTRITTLETNLPKEIQDRTDADNELRTSIQANTKAVSDEANKREKDDSALGVRIDTLQSNLSAETQRATEKENSLSDAIGINTESLTNLTNTVEQNKKDLTCSVKNTENVVLTKEANASGDGYVLSGNVVVSSSEGNIIGKNGALFASVDLQYNSANNTLTFLTSNNASKEIKLNIGSIIQTIYYDAENKRLVITYIDSNQETQTVYVPVADLYNEWIVEDRDESVIKLTKVKGLEGQPDILKADLKLATPESGNLLENANGVLYASNKALDIKLSDHVGTNVEAAIINLNDRITTAEGEVGYNTELVKQLEQTVNEHTTLIQNNKSDIDNLKIENNQNKQNIVEIKEDITEINGRLDGHDSSINEINTTIESIEKNIEDLQSKSNITAEDTNTVDLTFTSTTNSSNLKAEVKVSKEANNLITVKDDGLHVLEDYDFGTY